MGTGASMDDNTPDKNSGLTKRQKIAVRKLWKQIESNTQTHSVKVFLRFFAKHPGYRKFFASEGGAEMTKVAEDAHVQSHFRAIVASISALIKSMIGKPKSLNERLKYLAMLHKDMGLSMKDFGNFRDVLVDYLKAEFPKEMTIFEITAWNMFLTTMFQRICTFMDEFNKQDEEDKLNALPSPQSKKKRLLGKVFKRGAKKRDQKYWQDRKVFWRMQREMWSENKSSEDLDDLLEGEKDVGQQIIEAVSSMFSNLSMNLNPDAQAKDAAKKSLSTNKQSKPDPVPDIMMYDIPMPEGGLNRRGSQAVRPNAGNMRPGKSPSSSQPPPGKPSDGCLPCTTARGRRRNSFMDTYKPSAQN